MRKQLSLPRTGTKAAKEFYTSWHDINRLFNFVLRLAGSAEHVATTAHSALIDTEHDPVKRAKMEAEWKKRRTAIDELKANRQLLLETILVRHIENFVNYLSAVLFEIFTSRPETLNSSDKVEVSEVLQHGSIESLVRVIAETKVDSLSYSSFGKLSEFFHERFRIGIADDSDLKLIHEYIEVRNISVHNRCYINKRFIARMKLDGSELGKKKHLYVQDLDVLIPKLAEVVKGVDVIVRRKLKIKGVRFGTA
jgi:hypothetical protein